MDDKNKPAGKKPESSLAPTRGQTMSRDEWIARALAAASARSSDQPVPPKTESDDD